LKNNIVFFGILPDYFFFANGYHLLLPHPMYTTQRRLSFLRLFFDEGTFLEEIDLGIKLWVVAMFPTFREVIVFHYRWKEVPNM